MLPSSMKLMLSEVIALGSGSGLVHNVFVVLIIAICLCIVWWFGDWAFKKLGVPAIVLTVWMGFFILLGVIIVLNFLLSLVGHGFITY